LVFCAAVAFKMSDEANAQPVECPEGKEPLKGNCVDCKFGFYKVNLSSELCKACSKNKTTAARGSKSQKDCKLSAASIAVNCILGAVLIISSLLLALKKFIPCLQIEPLTEQPINNEEQPVDEEKEKA
ncbi:MAG: hypothetical protein MHPSP_004415, partial [Paramarteilia canceri]